MLSLDQEADLLARAEAIPISKTLRMRFLAWDEGTCQVEVPYDPAFDGVFESFHGGILMTIADSVACFAVLTLTGADRALTTTE